MNTDTQKVDVLAVMDTAVHAIAADYRFLPGEIREARAAVAELIAKAKRFGHLFEAWNRDDDSVPAELQETTERDVIEAMYDMRAAVARVGGAA